MLKVSPSDGAIASSAENEPKKRHSKNSADAWDNQAPLRVSTKLFLGLGGAVNGIYVFVGGFYLNNFFLETCCLDPVAVGLIQLIQCVFDAVNDPFCGYLSDRTRTRWGRRRPWLLFGAPFLAFSYVALWQTLPRDTAWAGKFVYHLLTYMCVSIGVTMVDTQINSLVPELTSNYDERTVVSAYRTVFANIVGLVSVVIHSLIVSAHPSDGYRYSSMAMAAIMWSMTWTVFFGIREKFDPAQEQPKEVGLMAGLKLVFTNKAFACVCLMYVLGPMAVYFVQSNLVMYCKYVIGSESLVTVLLPAVLGTAQLTLPFWVWLSSKIGKRSTYHCGCLLLLIAFSIIVLIPGNDPAGTVACGVLIGSSIIVPYFIPVSMLPDVIEDDELRSGERREGVFSGFFTTPLKLSVALGASTTNLGLKAAGYVSPASTCAGTIDMSEVLRQVDIQPEAVQYLLKLYLGPIPASLMVLAMIVAWFFPITRESHRKMLEQIQEARQEARNSRHEAEQEENHKELTENIDAMELASNHMQNNKELPENIDAVLPGELEPEVESPPAEDAAPPLLQ